MQLMNNKPKKTYQRIDSKEFVEAWMDSSSLEEVIQRLSLNRSSVISKAHSLRTIGVKLPYMSKNNTNVHKLNKLIEKMSR